MSVRPDCFRTHLSPSALLVGLVTALVVAATGSQAVASDYVCQSPIQGTDAARAAFAEYYECVEPITQRWLEQYPTEARRLEHKYELWEFSRDHDLRDSPAAEQFVDEHPVDFSERRISLTPDQVQQQQPLMVDRTAQVEGMFQRFFVDRAAARLFVTTDTQGLVSLDISERYNFEVESAVGQAGATDFFVIDEKTAVVEEPNDAGNARDLVVLDISDRSEPREVRRLHSVLPRIRRPNLNLTSIPDRPPTFDEYRAIQEGHFRPRECGTSPGVSTYYNQHCRPDGQCFVLESRSDRAGGGSCERSEIRDIIAHRRAAPRPAPRPRQQLGLRGRGRGGGGGTVLQRAPQPVPEADGAPAADMAMGAGEQIEESTPQGGDGGAGSLSQMMVHGSTLYVLATDHRRETGWLISLDISDPRQPTPSHLIGVDNGPEALQAHDNLLLVAGRDALLTASTAVDNEVRLLGERRQNCPVNFDPVVVEGAIAYRTVIIDDRRRRCNSRLEVIDLKQPHEPKLRTTEAIGRPRGLAVLGDRLFVADENRGVRLYDITDRADPKHRHTWRLSGVKDLVISDFDLYAMTPHRISTYYVAPLFQKDGDVEEIAGRLLEHTTVIGQE